MGTILHPARDGEGIAEVGELYGLTHSIQAIGLLVLAIGLANLLDSMSDRPRGWMLAVNAALVGMIAWFGLIVYDGAHNPAMAEHAPELVHTSRSLDIGSALIVVPALILFPVGNGLFGRALIRHGHRMPGLLIGVGAVIYTVGGTLIFPLGPTSSLIQPMELIGALALALGYVLIGVRGNDPG